MKSEYPNYKKEGTLTIEQSLKGKDRITLNNFLTFCRGTSNDYKVNCRKSELLQVRDIIGKDFTKWNLENLRGFLAILNHSNRKAWTKKSILITLGMFIKWNFKDWSSRFNNLEDLRKLNRLQKPDNSDIYNNKTLPTAEEIDLMIRKAKHTKDKLYISMCSEAGLPPKVQLNLKWADVKIDSPEENISTLEYFRSKNKESFIFPLGKTTTYYLKQWLQQYEYPDIKKDDFIFPSPKDREKPLSQQTAWYMFKRLAVKAGIDKPMYQYLLRHKTLSDAYDTFTEETHRKLFGHTKGSIQTKTYSHEKNKEKILKEALLKLHKVEEITQEQQNKYDREIKELKQIAHLQIEMLNLNNLYTTNKISKNKFHKLFAKLELNDVFQSFFKKLSEENDR